MFRSPVERTAARGTVTVDEYLGSISQQNVAMRQPPPELAARFARHAGEVRGQDHAVQREQRMLQVIEHAQEQDDVECADALG